MKKRIILKKSQLEEYINKKKSQKIYEEIMVKLYHNVKFLNESINLNKANKSIIDFYEKNGKLNDSVKKLLKTNNIS